MAYITIDTIGDAKDFGDLTSGRDGAGMDNGTSDRGCLGGGDHDTGPAGDYSNILDYITISSVGDSSDFGDLSQKVNTPTGTSNATNERGIRANGVVGTPWNFTQ
jgi:hypothetical protein